MIYGCFVNLNNFRDIRIIHQGQNTTISIATDATNPTNRYIFKTFNFNCSNGHQQKIFSEAFSDVSLLTLSNSSIPASNYAIAQNKSIFSFFNSTHYYESYSSLDFKARLKPTFCSICISEITLDKILRQQVQIASSWNLEDTLKCLFSVAISMKRLHDNLIIHGNLCPSNILVDKAKQCYISDFGLYRIKELFYKLPCVNTQYSAPEIDQFNPTRASDVFSYGVIMCRLLRSYLIPNNPQNNNPNLVQLIMEGRNDFLSLLNPFFSNIIRQCLDRTPSKRCKFDEIIHTFQAKSFVIQRINLADLFSKFKQQDYIEKLASVNDPLALNILGDLLSDPSKAFEINDKNQDNYQRNKKNADNQYSNLKYERQIDERMAADCYKKSAALGNSDAQANYGICLLNGNGCQIDLLNGITNIEKSANQGCIKGLFAYGMCFMKGIGVNQIDLNRAEQCFRSAADASESSVNTINNDSIICKAKFNLGLIMEKKNNIFEAARYFKMAAYMASESRTNFCSPTSFVCPEALFYYGCYLKDGIGIPPDITAACHFFKMAHFQGYRPGSFEYARLIIDNDINSNGFYSESASSYDKDEAILIMKSLAEMKDKKAIEYINENKLNLISDQTIKENSKSKERDKERNKDRNRDKDKNRDKDRDKDSNKDRERDIDRHREKEKKSHSDSDRSSESSKNRQKKLLEKFDKLQNDLIENQNQHLFDYEDSFIESKNGDIIYKLATLYNDGKYTKKDITKANNYYKIAADLGNPEAQAQCGEALIKKDFESGLKMLQKSAMQGNFNGMNYYSIALINGKNTDPKIIKCVHSLKEMADKGSHLAQMFYGKLLIKGPKNDLNRDKERFHKDPTEGVKYIKMAVDGNEPRALYVYATCMLKGTGMPPNEKKAMQLMESVANNEDDETAILKCYRYYKEIDLKKSLTFLKKLADKGNKDYMFKYGVKLIKEDTSEEEVKIGEEYLIKSGKEIPRDIQLQYYVKKSNGKYVEIQNKTTEQISYHKKLKKLEEAFSDDYEFQPEESTTSNSSKVSLKKEDQADQYSDSDDIELEPDNSNQSAKSDGSNKQSALQIKKTKLSVKEEKKIDKKIVTSFLKKRLENGLVPEGTNEFDFLSAAYSGDTVAMNYLGELLSDNESTAKYGSLLAQYSSDRGDPNGQLLYAYNLYYGKGVRPNYKKSYDIYQELVEHQDYAQAYYHLGIMNEEGRGYQRSVKKGFICFQKAADLGIPEAMLKVAQYYKKGIKNSLPKNYDEMVRYLKMAVEKNSQIANYKLGKYYLLVEKNPKEAFNYLKEANTNKVPQITRKVCYLLYVLHKDFDSNSMFMTKQESLDYLNSSCEENYSKALKAYKELYYRPFKPETKEVDDDDFDDRDDFEYNGENTKRNNKKNSSIPFIPMSFNNNNNNNDFEYYDDKDFLQRVLGNNNLDITTEEIIQGGDDILAKAKENFEKKELDIKKDSISKTAETLALSQAKEDFNKERNNAKQCYSIAMKKGDPLAYFKYAQLTEDREDSLNFYQYAKDNEVPGADEELFQTLEEICESHYEKFIKSKKDKNNVDMKIHQNKLLDIAAKFTNEKAFITAAIWYKKAENIKKYESCIDFALNNLDILDGKQQFLLAQILESKDGVEFVSSSSEPIEYQQKKKARDIYKLSLQKGYKESEKGLKRLSNELLSEMKSNSDDSQTLNEIGLSFLDDQNGEPINYEKAASYFEKASASGNIDAIVNYGKCLLFGKGVKKDDQKAIQYFKRACMTNSNFNRLNSFDRSSYSEPSSDIESSTTSSESESIKNDDDDEELSPTIDRSKGNESIAEAILYYSYCLMKRTGEDSRFMKLFKLSAKMGNVNAMLQYGIHFINEPDAPFFLKTAADSGNPEAQYIYSDYLQEKGDNQLSLKYLKQAASNRNYKPFFDNTEDSSGYYEPAVEKLGNILFDDINNDTDSAIYYFKKLVNDHNIYGLKMYAKCIYEGLIEDSQIGSPETEYRTILKKAADLGDSESQYLYAYDKMEDEDELKCSEEVSKYLKLAADQGNEMAAALLAQRLEAGKGIEKDLKEAIKYWEIVLSIDPDNVSAKTKLEQCERQLQLESQ